jgi:hypothetical protein
MALLPLIGGPELFSFSAAASWLYQPHPVRMCGREKRPCSYKREARKIRYEQKNGDYTRKCAVCGQDRRGLSRIWSSAIAPSAPGYHCFCQDHINNHVHFKE